MVKTLDESVYENENSKHFYFTVVSRIRMQWLSMNALYDTLSHWAYIFFCSCWARYVPRQVYSVFSYSTRNFHGSLSSFSRKELHNVVACLDIWMWWCCRGSSEWKGWNRSFYFSQRKSLLIGMYRGISYPEPAWYQQAQYPLLLKKKKHTKGDKKSKEPSLLSISKKHVHFPLNYVIYFHLKRFHQG